MKSAVIKLKLSVPCPDGCKRFMVFYAKDSLFHCCECKQWWKAWLRLEETEVKNEGGLSR